MKKIYILTGHYGSGKTNLSINLAIKFVHTGAKTAVVDMDIVNPYFRTADFRSLFCEQNISFYSTLYANTNLDIPAISFDIAAIISDHEYIVLDVGGDDTGAVVLGRYHDIFEKYKNNIEMIYVINRYRDTGENAEAAVKMMRDIEKSARFCHTKIVNNSNIGILTAPEDIAASLPFANEVSIRSGIPVMYHTADKSLRCSLLDKFAEYIDIYVKNIF